MSRPRLVGVIEYRTAPDDLAGGLDALVALMAALENLDVTIAPRSSNAPPLRLEFKHALMFALVLQILLHRGRLLLVVSDARGAMNNRPIPLMMTRAVAGPHFEFMSEAQRAKSATLVTFMPDCGPSFVKDRTSTKIEETRKGGRRIDSLAAVRHGPYYSWSDASQQLLEMTCTANVGRPLVLSAHEHAKLGSRVLCEVELPIAVSAVLADLMIILAHRASTSLILVDPAERMVVTETPGLLRDIASAFGIRRPPGTPTYSGYAVSQLLDYAVRSGVPFRHRLSDGALVPAKFGHVDGTWLSFREDEGPSTMTEKQMETDQPPASPPDNSDAATASSVAVS